MRRSCRTQPLRDFIHCWGIDRVTNETTGMVNSLLLETMVFTSASCGTVPLEERPCDATVECDQESEDEVILTRVLHAKLSSASNPPILTVGGDTDTMAMARGCQPLHTVLDFRVRALR
ncbi:hypothetical protein K438DRAFT_1823570 [Mycena galopus ATCC 62051]|nr:hypothetical protein K438DRAFT_1823570 [Mycena galopus ATCC 62051]